MLNKVNQIWLLSILTGGICVDAGAAPASGSLELKPQSTVTLIGGGLGSRMGQFGFFESEVQLRHPDQQITIRNLCDEGDTPGFRPHSGRPSPWAFPGAEKFYAPLSEAKDRWGSGHTGVGDFEMPDQWIARLKSDVVIGFFGYSESFRGPAGLDLFKEELRAFIEHTLSQSYNGKSAPQLALVSPLTFEDLSKSAGTPDGQIINANLALYVAAMEDVANQEGVLMVNLFSDSQDWFQKDDEPWTQDGVTLKESGYKKLAPRLADGLFGSQKKHDDCADRVLAAVNEKNWMWLKYYKIPNGVHVFGRRHRPFGPDNYPHELKKLEEMVAIRDQAIWAALQGDELDLAAADSKTHELPKIETNYRPSGKNGSPEYLYGEDSLATFKMAPGYRLELFASEKEFTHLANPVQMSFDNRGRLWIATMPTYPHYQPGDARPNDKLIILEDTDSDGRADRETVFADGLHLPTGFELAAEGVYVAQGNHLVLLKDLDNDDHADVKEIILSGFDDHDTHHVISAFCADPSGAIYMGEGTFLHSNVETAYGPERSSNGGFWRFDPNHAKLERVARLSIPNPWGTAFDRWGQPFFLDTSDPNMRWMTQGMMKVPYGDFAPLPPNLIENAQRVRPTSGLEFVSSRHFPEEVQGDYLLNNTIGFLGTKQHSLVDEGTGYVSKHRQDLITSTDGNYRPVDLEFAPDGSLYILDWHNVLVGHMQHSARDPLRDHVHGRVYRITYPDRPLVQPAEIYQAPIHVLLENLKLPEYRTRYRTRRELRGRTSEEVLPALKRWAMDLDQNDPNYDHYLVEALWVSWGLGTVDNDLLLLALNSKDFHARAAGVQALKYADLSDSEMTALLQKAAQDPHGRVRLLSIVTASWLKADLGLPIVKSAGAQEIGPWIEPVYQTALAYLSGDSAALEEPKAKEIQTKLTGMGRELFLKGREIYRREGHCITCHQEDGKGLPAAQFPPLEESEWVTGSEEALVRLTLHGLMGPIEVKGVKYPGQVPMTAFKGLSDEEIASVLTYVKNSFGNQAKPVLPEKVKAIRAATSKRSSFYQPKELIPLR